MLNLSFNRLSDHAVETMIEALKVSQWGGERGCVYESNMLYLSHAAIQQWLIMMGICGSYCGVLVCQMECTHWRLRRVDLLGNNVHHQEDVRKFAFLLDPPMESGMNQRVHILRCQALSQALIV